MFGNAEAYERFMGRWSRLMAPLLVNFAELPDSGRVLDIGSGTGSLSFAIAQSKVQTRVSGIDKSPDYVAYASHRNPFGDRVTFQVGDAEQPDFPDAIFEASLSLLVFNFIPDRLRALQAARRVTRPGGSIAAAVWDYSGDMQMLRRFWHVAEQLDPLADGEGKMPLSRSGELTELWKQGGLENVYEQPLDILMHFYSFADYWEPFLLGQGPAGAYARTLDPTQLDALRRELKRQLVRNSDDVPFTLTARAWAVRGKVPFN